MQKVKQRRVATIVILMMVVAVAMLISFSGTAQADTEVDLYPSSLDESMSVPELDSLSITVTRNNGNDYLSFPDFPETVTYNGITCYGPGISYEVQGYDSSLSSLIGDVYEIPHSYFKDKNVKNISVDDMLFNGLSNKPVGGLPANTYRFRMILTYTGTNFVDGFVLPFTVFSDITTDIEYLGDPLPLPTPIVKPGYNFVGWYFDREFTRPYDGSKITANTSLFAKYDAIVYNIMYEVGSSAEVSGNTSYTVEDETYTLPVASKTGYNFVGWYDNASCSGNAITEIPKGSTGDKTFYAKFEIQHFTVTFYVDGDVFLEMDVVYGTRLVNFYVVNPETMTAVALSLTEDMNTSFDYSSEIVDNVALFADKEFLIYVGLTYNIDGVETMDLLDYNSSMSSLRVPAAKEGFKFEGWYYDSDFKTAVSDADKLTRNTTVYAKFKTVSTPNTIKEKIAFCWSKIVEFLAQWWWFFAIGGGVILVCVAVAIFVKKK